MNSEEFRNTFLNKKVKLTPHGQYVFKTAPQDWSGEVYAVHMPWISVKYKHDNDYQYSQFLNDEIEIINDLEPTIEILNLIRSKMNNK